MLLFNLSDRFQQVYYAKYLSNASITCGVPQGSISYRTSSLSYNINDIVNCTNNLLFYRFADDASVFVTAKKNQTLFDNMNSELPNLSNWFNRRILISYLLTKINPITLFLLAL